MNYYSYHSKILKRLVLTILRIKIYQCKKKNSDLPHKKKRKLLMEIHRFYSR